MQKIIILALTTFRESVRSKVLYSILFFAVGVVLLSSIFGLVTIGDQVKVIKDFGLFSITLFGVIYVTVTGSTMLHRELIGRTIFNVLAKPVKRYQFLAGKFLGMLLTVTVMMLVMAVFLLAFVALFEGNVDPLLFPALYCIFLQITILCAVVILFSSILVTPFLSGALAFVVFAIGRSTEFMLKMVEDFGLSGLSAEFSRVVYFLLPHLDKLDISNTVVHGVPSSFNVLFWNSAYALFYSVILLLVASFIFSKREFN